MWLLGGDISLVKGGEYFGWGWYHFGENSLGCQFAGWGYSKKAWCRNKSVANSYGFRKHSAGFLLCGYPVATSPSWKVENNFVGDGAILVETAWDVSLLVGAFPKKLGVETSRWRILVVFCCWLLRVYLIADIHRIFARDTNFHIRPCSRQVICARCGITRARRRFWGALSQRLANLKVRGCTRAKAQ